MSKSDDDEEIDTLQKRKKRHEDITMRVNVDPQQTIESLRKQQQQSQRQKEKSISFKFDQRLPISLKQERRSNEQEHQRWLKKEPEFQAQ